MGKGITFGNNNKDEKRIKWSPLLVEMEKYALDHGGMNTREQHIFRAGWNAGRVLLREELEHK